ncbi:hypothetical protein [Streptomyces hypolithicus]
MAVLWAVAGVMATAVWAVSAAALSAGLAAEGQRPAMEKALNIGVVVAFSFIVVGGLHACIQQRRLDREQRRVCASDRKYLSEDVPN